MIPYLFQTALTLHIVGFVMLAGIMLADFVTFRKFWKLVNQDGQKVQWLRKMVSSFAPLTAIGGILVVGAGVTLYYFMPGVHLQLWFKLKMILVVAFILNMIFIGPRQNKKLDKIIASQQAFELNSEIGGIKKWLNFFYVSQLLIMLIIFILSAFRF